MKMSMEKVVGKDEVQITIYAEPIKVMKIKDGYVWMEWEGRRWKEKLPTLLARAILSDLITEEMRGRFLVRLNALLAQVGEEDVE